MKAAISAVSGQAPSISRYRILLFVVIEAGICQRELTRMRGEYSPSPNLSNSMRSISSNLSLSSSVNPFTVSPPKEMAREMHDWKHDTYRDCWRRSVDPSCAKSSSRIRKATKQLRAYLAEMIRIWRPG